MPQIRETTIQTRTRPPVAGLLRRVVACCALAFLCLSPTACAGLGGTADGAAGSPAMRRGVVSPPKAEGLFPPAESVVSFDDRVEFSIRPTAAQPEDALLLLVPPTRWDVDWTRIELTSVRTNETLALTTPEEIREFFNGGPRDRALDAANLGTFRRVQIATVRYDTNERMGFRDEVWRLAGVTGALRFDAWRPSPLDDTAFFDPAGPYQRYLGHSVANPEMTIAYAGAGTPFEPGVTETPTWRPDPALSKDGWLRIEVREDDLYHINARWLAAAGWDANAHPGDFALVSRGELVPVFTAGPEDATFAEGGRLLFYGLGSSSHETAARVYYLGRPAGDHPTAPAWLPPQGAESSREAAHFTRRRLLEDDVELKTRVGSFLSISEMTWVWEPLVPGEPFRQSFDADGLTGNVISTGQLKLYITSASLPKGMALDLEINGQKVLQGEEIAVGRESIPLTIPAGTLSPTQNELVITLTGDTNGAQPLVFLDSVELDYRSQFKEESGRLAIDFSQDNAGGWSWANLVGFRATQLLALDITDPESPVRVLVEGVGRDVRALLLVEKDRRFLIMEADRATAAPAPSTVRWDDLWSPAVRAEYLVITHEFFADEARRLAASISADTGMSTRVVDIEAVYDNFSDGETSTLAIRRYLAHLLAAGGDVAPTYALLVGDCTSDGRGEARNDVVNYVPTHTVTEADGVDAEEYAADAYFTWLLGDDEVPDVFLGRLSVASREDAAEVVDKIISYRAQETPAWAGQLLTITDAGEFENVQQTVHARSVAPWTRENLIALSRLPWENNFYLPPELLAGMESKVSPVATTRIQEALESGAELVVYYGHGSPNIWSNQRIWFAGDSPNSDNLRLANRDRLPFMASLTCNNGAIDYPVPRWNICFAEDMMRVPNGGIIGCFVPSGPGYTRNHGRLADGLLSAWSGLGVRETALLCELSRLKYMGAVGADDHSRMFLLLGDPSLGLHAGPKTVPIEIEPAAQPARGEEFTMRVNVLTTSGPIAGHARIVDSFGHVFAEGTLEQDSTGALVSGALVGRVPHDSRPLRVQADLVGTDGRRYAGGTEWLAANPEITIDQVRVLSRDERTVGVEAFLTNQGHAPAEVTVRVTGPGVPATEHTIHLEPREQAGVPFSVTPSAPTGVIEVAVPKLGQSEREAFALPVGLPGSLGLVPDLITITQGGAQLGTSVVEVSIVNPGTEGETATLHWRIHQRRAILQQSYRELGYVAPGTARRHSLTVGLPSEIAAPHTFEVIVAPKGEAPDWSRAVIVEYRPDEMGDLVAEDIAAPGPVTEGATVFVEARISNRGGGPTRACSVALESTGDTPRDRELRNLAGPENVPVPALAPGESWPVRLRWDPRNNLETDSITLVIDPKNAATESNKANNRIPIPVRILSMWQLAPLGMAQGEFHPSDEPGSPGVLPLIARVANRGETDARRVSVSFYRTEVQEPGNLMGEVIVDRIPAGQTVDVVYEWDLAGEDPSAEVRPSFDLAIKGSLQRISSVTE